MAGALRHRGPDGCGRYAGPRVGLAHVRLSIIDVAGGAQPLGNEDGSVLVVYNGEVYNYLELRTELSAAGHRFRTRSDTEVLVHAYEQWGTGMLGRLNGQFAFAIYDRRTETVMLARDRFGVRPLFYAIADGDLFFASEAKALFASGGVEAAPDFVGLDQVFTFLVTDETANDIHHGGTTPLARELCAGDPALTVAAAVPCGALTAWTCRLACPAVARTSARGEPTRPS